MSGTFENIDVPPTLISFAVTSEDIENIISPEFKKKGKIGVVDIEYNELGMLDLNKLKENFENINKDIKNKNIISATVAVKGVLAQIYEMAVGNTGFDVTLEDLYSPKFATFVVEYLEDRDYIKEIGRFSEDIIVKTKRSLFKYT